MSIVENLQESGFVEGLGWTLLHSVWQVLREESKN